MGRPVLGRAEIIGTHRARHRRRLHAAATTPRRAWCSPRPATSITTRWSRMAAARLRAAAAGARGAQPSRRAMSAAICARSATSSRCMSCWAFPASPIADPDYYAASVLSTALGGGMSSRLFQEVREKRGLVYSIYSFTHAYSDGGVVRRLCRHRRGRGRRADAGDVRRDPPPRRRARSRRARAGAGAAQGRPADVAREHHGALRAAGGAYAGLSAGRSIVAEIVARIEAVDDVAVARVARGCVTAAADPDRARSGRAPRALFDRIVARLGA